MQERIVAGVLRVVAKRESSFVGLRARESGTRVMRFGAESKARVQGMRRKGAVVSEGAIIAAEWSYVASLFFFKTKRSMLTRRWDDYMYISIRFVENEQMDKLSSLPSLHETKDGGAVNESKKYLTIRSNSRKQGEMISLIPQKQR
jgi:hypothetical protein